MPGNSYLTNLINCEAIAVQPIARQETARPDISIDVLRLDFIHPVISGNKFFKLKHTILKAITTGAKGIVSFGGAYSNHLVALACLCNELKIPCVGVIRGEQPPLLSFTLQDLARFNMNIIYVTRAAYSDKDELNLWCQHNFPGYIIIPEGGQSEEGVTGATEILQYAGTKEYDVVCCSVGTGTMMAGLLRASHPGQQLLGISSLKMPPGNGIEEFITSHAPGKFFSINYEYHFGGYAKSSAALIGFMNKLWHNHQLPTDFVYTAKMFYGLFDLVEKNHFVTGCRILAIHSGGLQGNRSLAHLLDY